MWQYAFSSLKEGRQLLYYLWRNAATCLTPATRRLCMQKKCLLPMQICTSKANVIACFSSTWENTTAFFFFPLLHNKVGALRYPSVSKTVVCTVDIVFIAAASFALLPKGCQTVCCRLHHPLDAEKPSPRSFFFFFFFCFIFSHISAVLCVHRHNLSLHVSVAFIQINSNHRATPAESDDRLGD